MKIDETSRNVKFYVQENQFTLSFLKIFSPSVVAFLKEKSRKDGTFTHYKYNYALLRLTIPCIPYNYPLLSPGLGTSLL